MNRFSLLLVPLGLGLTAGLVASRPPTPHAARFVDARRPAPAASADLSHGEAAPAVSAEIVPEAVTSAAGDVSESLALRVDVSSILPGTPRYRTALEITDDRGHAVKPAELTPVRVLAKGVAPASLRTTLPAGLADGFYQVHATVAAASGAQDGLAQASLYVEVVGGTVRLIDSDEFYIRSNANQGVKL
jgi:hypothetical protein